VYKNNKIIKLVLLSIGATKDVQVFSYMHDCSRIGQKEKEDVGLWHLTNHLNMFFLPFLFVKVL